MILGVGADILEMARITQGDDAFFAAIFTPKEGEAAKSRPNPMLFYATRFAGKEAVYKCFGEIEGEIRLNEIEILPGANGKPVVTLSGACLAHAEALGIRRIHISLSYDGAYAIAYAVAEG